MTKSWKTVCSKADLVNDGGICALVEQQQIAIFHLTKTTQKIFAIANFDPIGGANVLYRGIVGSIKDEPVVASPLYKQHFSLSTGKCLQDEAVAVGTFDTRFHDDEVQILI